MDEPLTHAQSEELHDEPPAIAGSDASGLSTRIRYTLRFTGWPNINQLVSIAVATATYTALSYVAVKLLPSPAPNISPIFFPIGFGLPFALWFGGWAFVIAYIGNFLGAGLLTGMSLTQAIPFGAADFIQLCLPMILYRLLAPRFGVDSIGKDVFTVRGFIFFLLCAVIPGNVLGGLYGNILLVQFGFFEPKLFYFEWFMWSITNMLVVIVIGSVVLARIGTIVERFGLTVHDALR